MTGLKFSEVIDMKICKTCKYYESGNCEYWSGEIEENDTCSHYELSKNVYEWQYSPLENIAICLKCRYAHYLGTYHQYATNFCPNCGQKMKPIN